MGFPSGNALALTASLLALPVCALAVDGQWTGVSQCFINGRWVTVRGSCPPSSGGSPSPSGGGGSPLGGALYGAGYQLGYAFGQWLFGGGSDPQEEQRKREMMEELRRRQAEAERQHREEEARRLAEIYNRLAGTLKLSGVPQLRMKGVSGDGGLKLKIGDPSGGKGGIDGLPGIHLNDGKVPYGVPGLPGIYTGGPRDGSAPTASGLALKMGDGTSGGARATAASAREEAPATSPAGSPAGLEPSAMTPRQLADVAEMMGRLPPEEQGRLLALAKQGAVGTHPGAAATASTPSPDAPPSPSGLSSPLPSGAPDALRGQAAASKSAAVAATAEDASAGARLGFDTPGGGGSPAGAVGRKAASAPQVAPPSSPGSGAVRIPSSAPSSASPAAGGGSGTAARTDESEGERIVRGTLDLAARLEWPGEERDRLAAALGDLDFRTPGSAAEIDGAWGRVLARGSDEGIAGEARKGSGPALPGAGRQTNREDCTIFALANAARLPYGVVAARAAELVRDAEWRSAAERANPQKVVEEGGLNGGEVLFLAEAFGRAEVVSRKAFGATLDGGRPLLVAVVPKGGRGEHEVVLTRAFRRGGEEWFEMMDSNQGADRRLYLSGRELDAILAENGVAFRPDPGRTAAPLR